MALKLRLKVIGAFSIRLVLVVPLVLHLLSTKKFYRWTNTLSMTSYDAARPFIYTQIILAIGIVTPTIPLLQPFMQATATSFGAVSGEATNSYGEQSGRHCEQRASRKSGGRASLKQQLKSLSSGRMASHSIPEEYEMDNNYTATVVHERKASTSGSDISQLPMIRRDVQMSVSFQEHDTR
jgi:hypothetical protein